MRSHFSAQTLAEIFRDLYLSERDGVLTLLRDDVEKHIFFKRGLIYHAESSLQDEDLGTRLLREEKISSGELEEARQHASDARDLPQVLVTRDLVLKDTLERTLTEHVGQLICSAFHWDSGQARFGEGPPLPLGLDCDVLSTCRLILSGVFEIDDFESIHEAMLGLDRKLCLRYPAPVPVDRLCLSPTHAFVLSRLDGATTPAELVSILPPGEERNATRMIYGLLVLGLAVFEPPVTDGPFRVASILRDHADRQALEEMQARTVEQAYSSMADLDPYEMLGVQRGAAHEAIERAYEEAKSMFGAERLLPQVRERFRTELAVIESRLIEAYLNLSRPAAEDRNASSGAGEQGQEVGVGDMLVRVEMDKTQSKLAREKDNKVAASYFAKTLKAQREGDFHNAIQFAKLALTYNDKDARIYFTLAECQAQNPGPRWQHVAEQNYSKASQLDPWNPEYLIALGHFYKRRGLKLRARRQFEEALRLSPQNEVATTELEALSD